MTTIWTRDELDRMQWTHAQDDNCDCGSLDLRAGCHVTAGLEVSYHSEDG